MKEIDSNQVDVENILDLYSHKIGDEYEHRGLTHTVYGDPRSEIWDLDISSFYGMCAGAKHCYVKLKHSNRSLYNPVEENYTTSFEKDFVSMIEIRFVRELPKKEFLEDQDRYGYWREGKMVEGFNSMDEVKAVLLPFLAKYEINTIRVGGGKRQRVQDIDFDELF